MSSIPAKSSSSEEDLPKSSTQTTPSPGFKTEYNPPPPTFRDVLRKKKIIAFELENVLCDYEAGFDTATQVIANRFRRHCVERQYVRSGTELDEAVMSAVRETKPSVILDKTPRAKDAYKHVEAMSRYFPIPQNKDTKLTKHLLKLSGIIFSLTLEQETKFKENALLLIRSLKKSGKTVVVFSEGPPDRAIKILERVGVTQDDIDRIITASAFGVTLKSGLFVAALKRLKARRADMIYVGDDRQRKKIMKHITGITSVWCKKDMDVGPWDVGVEWRNGSFRANCLTALLRAAEPLVVQQGLPVNTQPSTNKKAMPLKADTDSSDSGLDEKKKMGCIVS